MNELDHERYMRRAIGLAGKVPDLPFGAVIVDRDTGTILSEGWNKTSVNPTWHGEIDAINGLAAAGSSQGRCIDVIAERTGVQDWSREASQSELSSRGDHGAAA